MEHFDSSDVINQVVDILGPLTTKQRTVVLCELMTYRKHWFTDEVYTHLYGLLDKHIPHALKKKGAV